jgi:hypothetical protein
MAVAMHNYASTEQGRFPPPAVYSEDGRPLLSWRVLLLPYLEQGELSKQFKLDEPWDSPHNIRLLERMPRTYGPFDGSSPPRPFTTFYQVFVGEGTAFGGKQGLPVEAGSPDGNADTFLIVEAGEAVPWTKPEDLSYDASRPLPKLGGLFKNGGFRVAMVDGSVRDIPRDEDENTLRVRIARKGKPKPDTDGR